MPLETLNVITQAEETAGRIESDAAATAKQRIADAGKAGEAAVKAARQRAEKELEQSRFELEQHGKEASMAKARETEMEKTKLRTRAEQRLDQAAQLIVERIVNS